MFDFEKLSVYQKTREARRIIFAILSKKKGIDRFLLDQLKRAVIGIILNIAEGTGKSSRADKKNFFTIARGSCYEVAAIFDLLLDDEIIAPGKILIFVFIIISLISYFSRFYL